MFYGNSILKWRYHIFGHILGVYHGISRYIALKHRPKMLGTSNKSVLEMARRMHIAALWLMLTWRACWPSLRRIWRGPTGPKCRQNYWIPPLKERDREMDRYIDRWMDGWMDYLYTLYIYIYTYIYIYWMIQP